MSSNLRRRIEKLETTGQDGKALIEIYGHAFECMRADYARKLRPPAPKVLREMAGMGRGERLTCARRIWPSWRPGSTRVKPMIAYELQPFIETGELIPRPFCYDPSVSPIVQET